MDTGKNANFTIDLKEASNIAIIANTEKGLDALCAAVGLSELVNTFLDKKENYIVSIYYLDKLPHGSEVFADKIKIYSKIGEKTLKISFPTENVEKIQYDFKSKEKKFEIQLVGFKGSLEENKENIEYKEESESFDMAVGVGFKNEKDFSENVDYIKDTTKFVFNEKNMHGKTLCDGVIDLYFKENVKPSKLASLALFTALSYQ